MCDEPVNGSLDRDEDPAAVLCYRRGMGRVAILSCVASRWHAVKKESSSNPPAGMSLSIVRGSGVCGSRTQLL